ncbi:hypothetical protein GO986_12605 [Deinococcus sp. HMF7620]|uniref:Uncharacterized protein n=1 Tax=Deinococcus arboris TaxID=2682977 RepID=A0A7C9HSJ4_9DEIO|nr:hypothetical protein [Deinococcus arboris]MVN87607.1 hypothetical protein [Deinococcus arboris]
MDQVKALLDGLEEYMAKDDQESSEVAASQKRYGRRVSWSLALLAVALAATGVQALQPFDGFTLVYGGLVLMALLIAVVANILVVREQGNVFQSLRQPRPAMISALQERLIGEEAEVAKLLSYGLPEIQFARARLAQTSEIQKERFEAVFGAAGRLGMLPAILATAAATLPVIKGAPLWLLITAVVVAFLVVLTQNKATDVQMALSDLKHMLGLLDQAVTIKEKAKQDELANLEQTQGVPESARI